MADWILKYNGRELGVDYQEYYLTDGYTKHKFYRLQYKKYVFIGKSLEKVVVDLTTTLDRREKKEKK